MTGARSPRTGRRSRFSSSRAAAAWSTRRANILVEFPTASGAVRCALEIQRVLAARNDALPCERRLEFRIGVQAAVREGRAVDPTLSLEAVRRSGASPANIERMSAALRQAGLTD
jgi:hypothetical protein